MKPSPNSSSLSPHGHSHDRGAPYLFAYDIGDDRRARAVRLCLQRWRLDGQYSVHETRLLPFQARELAAELLDYVDTRKDRLLACRLSQRGDAPVHNLTLSTRRLTVTGAPYHGKAGFQPRRGWYLLAYDITDTPRLRRVQYQAAKVCMYLQRSVYLYHGAGGRFQRMLAAVEEEIERKADDVRIYNIAGPHDLWFLSGPLPPLAQMQSNGPGASLWRRLVNWLRTRT